MPGIAGVIGRFPKEEGILKVQSMIEAMMHEPFYATGIYANEQLGVYVGWVVHPDSFADCMPVESADRRVVLILDGEVFNSHNRSGLNRSSTASKLADLYQELGDDFFEELNGTFSGLVVDTRSRSMKLFNDRLAFQKMYWSDDGETGGFYFSSEAKSLLRVVSRTRELDREGLAQFLSYGCTFGEKTLYRGISAMPGASVWELQLNRPVQKHTYFRRTDWQTDIRNDEGSFHSEFIETFRTVVPRYFTEPRAAMSLTGGWDTRMILASLNADRKNHPCYTFGGMGRPTVDIQLARRIAELTGQEHMVLSLRPDFLTDFGRHAEKTVYVSDGYSDVCLSHELYLNRLARQISTIRVTGNFGSEVLRGMSTFKATGLRNEYFKEFHTEVARAREQLAGGAGGDHAGFAIFKEIPLKLTAVSRLAKSQVILRSPFLDNAILRLACMNPTFIGRNSRLAYDLVKRECPGLLGLSTDRGEAGGRSWLQGAAAKIFYRGTFKLDYLMSEGTPDFASLLCDFVSPDYLLPVRHKFLEYRRWFRGPLRPYIEEILGGTGTLISGLFGKHAIARTLRNNTLGTANELVNISTLLTIELIDRSLIRQPHGAITRSPVHPVVT